MSEPFPGLPDKLILMSDKPGPAPDRVGAIADKIGTVPDKLGGTPDKISALPDKGNAAPNKSTDRFHLDPQLSIKHRLVTHPTTL